MRRNVAGDVGGAAEHQLIGVDPAFHRSIYSGYLDLDHCVSNSGAHAYEQGPLLGNDLSGEVPVYAQRRFERNFAGKLDNVADEPQPIIFGYIYSRSPLFTSGKCLTTHGYLFLTSLIKDRCGSRLRQVSCARESVEQNLNWIGTIAFAPECEGYN